MNVSIQLNEGTAARLSRIQGVTHQDVETVIQQAIELYDQQLSEHVEQPNQTETSLEIAQRTGFIGCIQAEPELSKNYKSVVQTFVDERNS